MPNLRTWAEISLPTLAGNYRKLRSEVGGGVQIAGVVKANAYGHGAVEVSRVLEAEGAQWLAVSNVEEGVELRAAGIAVRILVMGGMLPSERAALWEFGLTPAVHSLFELRELDLVGKPLDVHLKIDTGMARLGMRSTIEEIELAVAALKNVHIEGLMTHFACPDDPAQTEQQLERFDYVLGRFRPDIVHAASSFALTDRLRQSRYNMVRPGIALYGYAPVCSVAPVLAWKARILAVRELPIGAPVGYGARFVAPRAMRTAVIAAGYADGLPRALTNCGSVVISNQFAAIVGAVSMDLTAVDVTEIPGVAPGDMVEIIGARINAGDIAEAAGTISYEILTGIGNRVVRIYRN